MTILDYPNKECPACGRDMWWYTAIEPDYKGAPEWKCGVCHPPPTEKGLLKMRIMKGNWVMSKWRWAPDTNTHDPEFVDGMKRLTNLGKQLRLIDNSCLYIENKKKMKSCLTKSFTKEIECYTCVNDYWWEQELFDVEKRRA